MALDLELNKSRDLSVKDIESSTRDSEATPPSTSPRQISSPPADDRAIPARQWIVRAKNRSPSSSICHPVRPESPSFNRRPLSRVPDHPGSSPSLHNTSTRGSSGPLGEL